MAYQKKDVQIHHKHNISRNAERPVTAGSNPNSVINKELYNEVYTERKQVASSRKHKIYTKSNHSVMQETLQMLNGGMNNPKHQVSKQTSNISNSATNMNAQFFKPQGQSAWQKMLNVSAAINKSLPNSGMRNNYRPATSYASHFLKPSWPELRGCRSPSDEGTIQSQQMKFANMVKDPCEFEVLTPGHSHYPIPETAECNVNNRIELKYDSNTCDGTSKHAEHDFCLEDMTPSVNDKSTSADLLGSGDNSTAVENVSKGMPTKSDRKDRQKVKKAIKKEEKKRKREEEIRKKLTAPKDQRITIIDQNIIDKFFADKEIKPNVKSPADSMWEFPALGPVRRTALDAKQPEQVTCPTNSGCEQSMQEEQEEQMIKADGDVKGEGSIPKQEESSKPQLVSGKRPKRRDPIRIDILQAIKTSESKQHKVVDIPCQDAEFNPRKKEELSPYSGNPLDSANPERKRGKVREIPRPKKLTKLKVAILEERSWKKSLAKTAILQKSSFTNAANNSRLEQNVGTLDDMETTAHINSSLQKLNISDDTDTETISSNPVCNKNNSESTDAQKLSDLIQENSTPHPDINAAHINMEHDREQSDDSTTDLHVPSYPPEQNNSSDIRHTVTNQFRIENQHSTQEVSDPSQSLAVQNISNRNKRVKGKSERKPDYFNNEIAVNQSTSDMKSNQTLCRTETDSEVSSHVENIEDSLNLGINSDLNNATSSLTTNHINEMISIKGKSPDFITDPKYIKTLIEQQNPNSVVTVEKNVHVCKEKETSSFITTINPELSRSSQEVENATQMFVSNAEWAKLIGVTRNIHSRRFREYCDHSLMPELNAAVEALLQDIVKFQYHQYQRNPLKAIAKRRHVTGLREVKKYLALKRLKAIIIAPNLEKVQREGGLDDKVAELKELATAQGVPYVFALYRAQLGKLLHKKVPVSCVGIVNYEGTESNFSAMMAALVLAQDHYKSLTKPVLQPQIEEKKSAQEVACTTTPKDEPVNVNELVMASFLAILSEKEVPATETSNASPFLKAIESRDEDIDEIENVEGFL